jgi:hypothetical protein
MAGLKWGMSFDPGENKYWDVGMKKKMLLQYCFSKIKAATTTSISNHAAVV